MSAPTPLVIAGRAFGSRLILGTGGFTRLETLAEAIEASRTEMVTVALRRIDPTAQGSLVGVLDEAGVHVLPNTAGCFTARDAVRTAKLAREAFETDWIKLEVIGDERTLLPDAPELLIGGGGARRRGLRRAALHDRRPGARAPPGRRRLRGGHAARLADRQRPGDRQPRRTSTSSSRARPSRSCSTRASARHPTRPSRSSTGRTRCSSPARSPAPPTPSRWRPPCAWPSRPGRSRAAAGRIERRTLRAGVHHHGGHPRARSRRMTAVQPDVEGAPRSLPGRLVGPRPAGVRAAVRARPALRGSARRTRRWRDPTRSATTPCGSGRRSPTSASRRPARA